MATDRNATQPGTKILAGAIGLVWAMLLGGCEGSAPDASAKAPEADPQTAIEAASQTKLTTPEPTPPPPKTLNLSREALEQWEQAGSSQQPATTDPDNMLPDLFEGGASDKRTRTSGRVLMREDAQSALQGIEGVEFKVEVPVN